MSLRVRMGLAAGVAVALAVIAVAVTAYAGTRSQLRGQVDQSLQTLAAPMLIRAGVIHNPAPPPPLGGGPARTEATATADSTAKEGSKADPDGAQDRSGAVTGTDSTKAAAVATASSARQGSRLLPPLFGGGPAGPPTGTKVTRGSHRARPAASARTSSRRVTTTGGSILGVFSGDCDNGLGIDDTRGPGFGGATGFVQLVSANAKRICLPLSEKTVIPVDAQVRALAATGHGHYLSDTEVGSTHLRTLVYGLGSRGALMVALPLTDVNNTLRKEILLLMLVAAAGILLAGLLGLLVARTALLPIARFTRQTETIALNPERLDHQRLDVHGGDELGRLASTFNRTLDALEGSVQAQRNLVADASHELRTPIATIRANLQLMRDEELLSPEDREALRADVIEELDELTALVGDVVELARGSKPSGAMGDVRLDQIASGAADRTRRRAPQLTVVSTLEPTLVHGEADRIARAVTNLLDNAGKWSPPGGTIEIELRDGVLSVRDHGPGFHEDDLPFVFDRFHRARDARSKPGSGLGLAIVRQAAEAHGGFVEATNAPDGGALMRISFGPRLHLTSVEEDALSAS
ncbi:MAG TPA: HAMP domain-containing sensor histidine kinase [Solirubrobacteraceae bacterium]